MKRIKIYVVQIVCIVFLLLAGSLISRGLMQNPGYDQTCEAYRSGWQVRAGEQELEYAELPQYLAGAGIQEVTLSRKVNEADTVGFFSFQQQVQVYLTKEEISQFDACSEEETVIRFEQNQRLGSKTPGNGWMFVELTPEDTGKILTIRIKECYGSGRVILPTLYHGTRMGITMHYLREKIPMFLFSVLGIMIGLMLLLIWGVSGQKLQLSKGLPWLALFAVFIGAWSAIEANIYSFFFRKLLLISWLSYLCLKMAVAPFIQFVNLTFHNGQSKILKGLTIISLMEFWITGALQFFKIVDFADTVFITHGVLMIASAYIILTAIPKLFHRSKQKIVQDQQITYVVHSIFILVVAVTSLQDMYGYYFTNNPDVAFYSRFGYFGYIIAVTVALLLDFMNLTVMGKQAAQIKQEAARDPMTQLYNRMEFEKDLERRTVRNSKKMGIIMLDLNNLKLFNDTCGHDAGDYYIIISSKVIQEIFDGRGKIYRIGGDEFCCVTRDLTEEDFETDRQRLEEKMKELRLPGFHAAMEVAAGYAVFDPERDQNIKDTMKRADKCMYERKRKLKEEKEIN